METEASNTPEAVAPTPTSPEAGGSTPPTPTATSPVAASPEAGSAPSASSETSQSSSTEGAEGAPSAGGVVEESGDTTEELTWNGELDALKAAKWFNEGIDEKYRNLLLDGMQSKYKNLEGGFTKKTQEMAEFRKTAMAKEEDLERRLARYERWLGSGEDLSAQALREADELRQQLEAATSARETAEQALREELEAAARAQLAPVEQERDQLRQQLEAAQKLAAEQEEQHNTEVLQGLVKWVDNTAPGLWDDDNEEALTTFTTLLETGAAQDPQTALKMVGALYPAFDPNAPEEVPPALEAANTDSAVGFELPGVAPERKSYAELKAQLEEQLRRAGA